MAEQWADVSTPQQRISKEDLKKIILRNVLNESLEGLSSEKLERELDSPLREPSLDPVTRRLFQSPVIAEDCKPNPMRRNLAKNIALKRRARKQHLLASNEKIKQGIVKKREEHSPELNGGAKKKMLISLMNNKEYVINIV